MCLPACRRSQAGKKHSSWLLLSRPSTLQQHTWMPGRAALLPLLLLRPAAAPAENLWPPTRPSTLPCCLRKHVTLTIMQCSAALESMLQPSIALAGSWWPPTRPSTLLCCLHKQDQLGMEALQYVIEVP